MSVQGVDLGFLGDLWRAIPRALWYVTIITTYTPLQWGLGGPPINTATPSPGGVKWPSLSYWPLLYAVRRGGHTDTARHQHAPDTMTVPGKGVKTTGTSL